MKKIIVTGIILGFAAACFAQNNGTLNLSTGQKYAVENKVVTKSTQEMQGQSMETNADVTSYYSIEVKDLKDNNYNMTNAISAMKMNMSAMGQEMHFDSDKKEDMDGEMGSKFKGFINHPQPVLMDKSGNIILSNQVDTAKKSDEDKQTEIIMKQMGGDPAEMGYGAKMAFIALPKDAKTGATWQDSSSSAGVTRVTNYTIKDIKGSTATLSISGTEKREAKMEMNGMEIITKTTGKFSGEETVDVKTGVIIQNTLNADAKGTVSVMGQDIPTTVTVSSVTTVKPI
jgi:Family of unknown function (DUF6263)